MTSYSTEVISPSSDYLFEELCNHRPPYRRRGMKMRHAAMLRGVLEVVPYGTVVTRDGHNFKILKLENDRIAIFEDNVVIATSKG